MRNPILYEINTRCWLNELTSNSGQRVTLGGIPENYFADWQRLGFTHIWLMGVWTCGKISRDQALNSPKLKQEYDTSLPGWKKSDVAGSPYSISSYQVPAGIGGETGLGRFRERLHQHGLKLVLDFVPNHLASDHPWVTEHPERFVQCDSADSGSFIGGSREYPVRLCHGRDPFFDPWMDTVQLDHRRTDTRAAMTAELQAVAQRCDGVRCDMAMLLINEIFAETWKEHPCRNPEVSEEFWPSAIRAIREQHAEFLFLAEAYWNREEELIRQGFDYTYQKRFTDSVIQQPEGVQAVVLDNADWLKHSATFLENHDEVRAASVLDFPSHRAAALGMLALPGLRFFHEGQLQGWKVKTPVQLGTRQREETNPQIAQMYETLITTLNKTSVGNGTANVLNAKGAWEDNDTARWILLIQWQLSPDQFHLVAINFAAHHSQCYVHLTLENLTDHQWQMNDLFSAESHERDGHELRTKGLYLDLPAHGAQCFEFNPTNRK